MRHYTNKTIPRFSTHTAKRMYNSNSFYSPWAIHRQHELKLLRESQEYERKCAVNRQTDKVPRWVLELYGQTHKANSVEALRARFMTTSSTLSSKEQEFNNLRNQVYTQDRLIFELNREIESTKTVIEAVFNIVNGWNK